MLKKMRETTKNDENAVNYEKYSELNHFIKTLQGYI